MNQIQKIVEQKLGRDRNERHKMPYLYSAIKNFLKNGKTIYEKKNLLSLVESTTYYTFSDISIYFQEIMAHTIYQKNTYILSFDGKGPSSSQNSIIHALCRLGYFKQDSILATSQLITIPKESSIIVIDDYCGSGDTIKASIDSIESFCENCRVLIIIYAIHDKALNLLEEYTVGLRNSYTIMFDKKELRYDRKIVEKSTLDFINEMCEYCSSEYRYGYKNTGALLSLEGKSPNNNISIIWMDDIDINERKWIPLFNRKENEVAFTKHRYKQILKNQEFITRYFKEKKLNSLVSLTELKFLIKVYNYSPSIIELEQTIDYFQNDKLSKLVESLNSKKIITLSEGYVRIESYVLLSHLKKIEAHFLKSECKRKSAGVYDVET